MMRYTIKAPIIHSIKIQRSEFIAFLHPVADAKSCQDLLREHQSQYSDATHNCYAYVLGFEAETQYYSDAGEPGGTAGKPILNSLLRNDLSGVLAIVTRYYGGIKLGVKGLIEAYTLACTEAIELSKKLPYEEFCHFQVTCDYPHLEKLRHQIAQYRGQEISSEYHTRVDLIFKIPKALKPECTEFLASAIALYGLEYIIEDKA
jgi:uncharacterized YigZ family protein